MTNRLRLLTRGAAAALALLVVTIVAAPAFAAPSMHVSQLTALTDGQTVTISGGGFEANLSNIAIGECYVHYVGPADCNTSGGATFKNADASGNISSFTLVMKEKFGKYDCTKVQCVIAAAPLPTSSDQATINANSVMMNISFGAPAATSTPSATATATTDPGTGGDESLPQTGAGDSVPTLLVAATAMVAIGVGLVLLVPSRQKGNHA